MRRFQLKQTAALPGIEGRIDHFAFDSAGERLFVCARSAITRSKFSICAKPSEFTRLPVSVKAWIYLRRSKVRASTFIYEAKQTDESERNVRLAFFVLHYIYIMK